MDQPLFWSALAGIAVLGGVARILVGRPLVVGRATTVGRGELLLAAVCLLVLAFHCGSMFFAAWTDALPGGRALGDVVRDLGTASAWAYWLPAGALMIALRKIAWQALVVLAGVLVGVGVTMFQPYPLDVHLAWIAAAVITLTVISSTLIRGPEPTRPRSD